MQLSLLREQTCRSEFPHMSEAGARDPLGLACGPEARHPDTGRHRDVLGPAGAQCSLASSQVCTDEE